MGAGSGADVAVAVAYGLIPPKPIYSFGTERSLRSATSRQTQRQRLSSSIWMRLNPRRRSFKSSSASIDPGRLQALRRPYP